METTELQPSMAGQFNDWNGEDDPENPRNWTVKRKTLSTVVVCLVGFVTTMAASIYAPGHEHVMTEFGVSSTVALLPLSSYNLGLAFGPTISSPLSETFGRKVVYLVTLPLFDVFVVGTGLSQTITTLVICRFFAGVFAAPGVSVSSATITDFTRPDLRAVPLSIYFSIPFIGSAIGPLIGSYVTESKGWRWTAWTTLIFAAVTHPPVILLKESYKNIILQKRAKSMRIEDPSGSQQTILQTVKEFVTTTVIRPVHMLTCEPTVCFICLFTGFQFALLYTFVVASPWVFATVYHFSVTAQGLSFIGLTVGCAFSPLVLITIDRYIYQPKYAKIKMNPDPTTQKANLPPEDRLYGAMIGSFVLPIGLFWFGWSARPEVHWICPIIATGFTILGSILIYVPCSFFVLDVYGSKYGASANGASSLSRYTLSAAFPLFVLQMYESLGVGLATTILGSLAIIMAPIPWVFYHFGPRLRARSAYEHGTYPLFISKT